MPGRYPQLPHWLPHPGNLGLDTAPALALAATAALHTPVSLYIFRPDVSKRLGRSNEAKSSYRGGSRPVLDWTLGRILPVLR